MQKYRIMPSAKFLLPPLGSRLSPAYPAHWSRRLGSLVRLAKPTPTMIFVNQSEICSIAVSLLTDCVEVAAATACAAVPGTLERGMPKRNPAALPSARQARHQIMLAAQSLPE